MFVMKFSFFIFVYVQYKQRWLYVTGTIPYRTLLYCHLLTFLSDTWDVLRLDRAAVRDLTHCLSVAIPISKDDLN